MDRQRRTKLRLTDVRSQALDLVGVGVALFLSSERYYFFRSLVSFPVSKLSS
jgi:hypothetical protein